MYPLFPFRISLPPSCDTARGSCSRCWGAAGRSRGWRGGGGRSRTRTGTAAARGTTEGASGVVGERFRGWVTKSLSDPWASRVASLFTFGLFQGNLGRFVQSFLKWPPDDLVTKTMWKSRCLHQKLIHDGELRYILDLIVHLECHTYYVKTILKGKSEPIMFSWCRCQLLSSMYGPPPERRKWQSCGFFSMGIFGIHSSFPLFHSISSISWLTKGRYESTVPLQKTKSPLRFFCKEIHLELIGKHGRRMGGMDGFLALWTH